jgi:hypothetical protein
LVFAGQTDEAVALARDVLTAAESSEWNLVLGAALTGYGLAAFETDPTGALDAIRRQDAISRTFGWMPGSSRSMLSRAEAAYGTPAAALDACEQGVRAYAESGDRRASTTVLAVLASLLHRLRRDEAAAVMAGAGASPTVAAFTEVVASIEHLRDTLGAATFESLAARGEAMETNAMFRYALEQIDEARAAL